MRPVMQLVTLGVRDQAASRRFYADGLGWPTSGDTFGDEVTFVVLEQGPALSLWSLDAMTAEIGPVTLPAPGTAAPFTLAHNVDAPAQVDDVLAAAGRAGATVHPARAREWGGYSGYFLDPDGYRWEVAHNPGLTREADGTVRVAGS